MSEALYAWDMRAQSWRDDPYYVSSSAPIYPVEVVASTKQEAIQEAARVLGSAGDHRHWRFSQIKGRDVRLVNKEKQDG